MHTRYISRPCIECNACIGSAGGLLCRNGKILARYALLSHLLICSFFVGQFDGSKYLGLWLIIGIPTGIWSLLVFVTDSTLGYWATYWQNYIFLDPCTTTTAILPHASSSLYQPQHRVKQSEQVEQPVRKKNKNQIRRNLNPTYTTRHPLGNCQWLVAMACRNWRWRWRSWSQANPVD